MKLYCFSESILIWLKLYSLFLIVNKETQVAAYIHR